MYFIVNLSLGGTKVNAIKVADEVWIATALLHRENPKREDFTVAEIVERVRREHIADELRPGLQVHAYLHCVANRPPNPACHRMLYATGKNTRRLFRETDDFDPKRRRGKVKPDKENIPVKYQPLLEWYSKKFLGGGRNRSEEDRKSTRLN